MTGTAHVLVLHAAHRCGIACTHVTQLFAHATNLLGYKVRGCVGCWLLAPAFHDVSTSCDSLQVVLLGRYNGQGLGEDYERAIQGVVVTETGLKRSRPSNGTASSATDAPPAASPGDTTVPMASAAASTPAPASAWASTDGGSAVQVQVRVTPGEEYIKVSP